MAQYERFDDDTPPPKFTVATSSNSENSNLFTPSKPPLSPEDQTTVHDAIITLNIISVFISSVCGVITLFLAIEDQSASALGFATDTILDVLAFLAVIWRFMDLKEEEKREMYVLRFLAILFFVSGSAVFIDSIYDLQNHIHPLSNRYLVTAAAIQTLIFSSLAFAKYLVAKRLQVLSAYSDALNTFMASLMALSVGVSISIYNRNKNVWYLDSMIGIFISMVIMCYGIWMMYKSLK